MGGLPVWSRFQIGVGMMSRRSGVDRASGRFETQALTGVFAIVVVVISRCHPARFCQLQEESQRALNLEAHTVARRQRLLMGQ